MFDKVGFYRTRGGRIAEVLTILDPRLQAREPLYGLYEGWAVSWASGGAFVGNRTTHGQDLVEYLGPTKPKRKKMVTKTIERWENIYTNGRMCVYTTKEQADRAANLDRIACVKLTGTYEVEEEENE